MSRMRHSNRRSRALLTAALVALPPMVPSTLAADAPAPVAKKRPTVRELHGDKFVDDYFWLREKTNPEVTAHLEAENAHAASVMAPYTALQDTLYKEMLGRIKETDLSVPVRDGAYFYYSRTEQGQQYPIYCRKKGSLEAPEEVYLDVNALAKGESFMAIGAMSVSDDGNLLAYTTDNTGFREYKLYVRDLRTGELLEQPAEKVTTVEWAADNKTLFYTTTDAAKRPYRLYRHAIGAGGGGTQLYEEKDERFSVGVGRSRSHAYLFLEVGSLTTSEVHYLPADQPTGTWKMVAARTDNHEYDLDHRGDQFFVRTNQGGRNFALALAPVSDPSPANWKTIVPHRADVMLQGDAGVRGPDRALRAGQRPAAAPRRQGRRRGVGRLDVAAVPRGRLQRVAERQPRVQDGDAALHLPVVHDAVVDLRLRLRHRRVDAAEGNRGAGRLRSDQVHHRAGDGDGARRHQGAGLAGLPEEPGQGRSRRDLPHRLRLVRHLEQRHVLLEPLQPDRSRRRLRDRAHPRRRRPRQALARPGPDAARRRTPSPTSSPPPST